MMEAERSRGKDAYHSAKSLHCYSPLAAATDLLVDYRETWSETRGRTAEERPRCAFQGLGRIPERGRRRGRKSR